MSFLDLSSSGKLGDQTQRPPVLLPTLIFGSLPVLPLLGKSVCHTVREGEDNTAATNLTEGSQALWVGVALLPG